MMDAPFQLFPALDPATEAALRASIQRFGVLVPIVTDHHGTTIDGHHRKRIADELKVTYRVDVMKVDADDAADISRTLNTARRHLDPEQRRAVVADLRADGHSLRAIAGAVGVDAKTVRNDLAGGDNSPPHVNGRDGKRYPSTVTAKNPREAGRAQQALQTIDPTVPVLDVKRAERVAREAEADRRRADTPESLTTHDDIEIRHGDFRHCLDDLVGQVDAIICDPPYERAYWQPYSEQGVYEDLGRIAAWLLKSDGILAVMTGTRLEMLDAVDHAIGRHMRRRHRAIYLTPGPRWRNNLDRVATGYKPILIYEHPDAGEPRWINDDIFTSSADDKEHHHWGQDVGGFVQIVERLTLPGHLVLDPFLGGGTTAIACRNTGRKFIGCDIDPAAVQTSRERLT